ncbi:MAG: FAD-dependent oxidoreductase [Candidatus Caldarchaeum sp.]
MAGEHDVVVVGGGVVGLLTSFMLKRKGFDVVVAAGKDMTKAASWGNAGYLAAGFGSPIPSAESISQILKWMMSGESPVKVSPSFFLKEITPSGWITQYLRDSRKTTGLEYALRLRKTCLESVELLKKIIEELSLETDFRSDGILEVYKRRESLEKHLQLLEANKELQLDYKFMDRQECLEEGPLLSKDIVGGILFREDMSLTPFKLVTALRSVLKEKLAAPVIDEDVVKINVEDGRVSSMTLAGGSSLSAREYVVCAGVHTRRLLSQAGVELPIVPAYGYMVMTEPASDRLSRPTAGGEFRVAMSQTAEGNLRATGFFELSNTSQPPLEERCRYLRQKAAEYVPVFAKLNIIQKWFGARPCTPDGLPVVGRVGYRNLVVAAGHCRLGVTTAASTAKTVADILTGQA